MNRYRNWVGALHWGQLLLLLPILLFAGPVLYLGTGDYASSVEDSARRPTAGEIYEISGPKRPGETIEQYLARERDAPQLLARLEAARQERATFYAAWVRRAGILGLALAWLTAFLSLWWWFGARAKPRGTA